MRNRTTTVVVNMITNYLRYLVGAVVMFLLTPIIIEKVGADDFGLWSLVLSFVGFLGLLDFGLATSTVRYVAECRGTGDSSRRNRLASTLLAVYAVLGLLALVVAFCLSFFFNDWFDIPLEQQGKGQLIFLIIATRVSLALPLSLFYGILFGEQKIHLVNIIQLASSVLYAIAAWLALSAGMGIVALAWFNLGAMLLEHTTYVVLAYRKAEQLRISLSLFSWRDLREVASFSIYTFVVNIAALVLLRTDPVLIKIFLPLSAVAVYAVAMKISEVGLMLTKQFVNVLAPLISELKATGDDLKIRFVLVNTTKFAFAPAVMLAVVTYLFATDAIVLWVGQEFAAAGPILMVLMTAMALAIPQMTASNILVMTGDQAFTAKASVASLVINIVASLALVGPLGILGVALGTLLATIVVDIFLVVRRACLRQQVPYWDYIRRALLPALFPGVIQFAVTFLAKRWIEPDHLLTIAFVCVPGVLAYLGVFWWRFVEQSEKSLLREKILKRKLSAVAP